MRKLVGAFVGLLLTAACTSIDCPVSNVVATGYSLMKADGTPDSLKDTMYVLTFLAGDKDTVLFNAGIGLSTFSLPISYTCPEDTLFFVMRNNDYLAIDTVLVKKENHPHFESVDCTPTFFHQLTGVRSTHHRIDTIVINHSQVDYESSTEHFHISFK